MKVNISRLWKYSFGKKQIVPGDTWKSLKINAFKICAEIAFNVLGWFFKGHELQVTRNQNLHKLIISSCPEDWGDAGGKRNVSEFSRFVLLFCETDNAYQQCLERILKNVKEKR